MGTRYNIMVTATDAATARIKAIKRTIGDVVRPITDVGRSVKALGKETGINKIASGVGLLARSATGAIRALGGLGGGVAGLFGVGALAAMANYSRQMANDLSATLRFSQVTGQAADKVQNLRGAAKLAGLEVGDMDGAIQNMGNTLQDARWGRNQGALMMMNRLGMKIRYLKNGAVDSVSSLGDLAEILGPGGKLASAPVQTKALVAQQFGAEGLLPLLLKGRKAWEDYQREAAKVKPPISQKDLETTDRYRKEIDKLGLSFDGLGQSLTMRVLPGMANAAKWMREHNEQAAKNIREHGIGGALARGYKATVNDIWQGTYGAAGRFLSDRSRPAKPQDPKRAQESIADFKRMGWSDAQAKGIVANMIEESLLDPRAVGDGGAAKGALQWHKDRQQNYARWAATQKDVKGKTIDSASLAEQRRFVNYELRQGAEKKAGDRLKAQTDAQQAAFDLSRQYVRPANEMGAAIRRANGARELEKNYPAGDPRTAPQVAVAANQRDTPTAEPAKPYRLGSDPVREAALMGRPKPVEGHFTVELKGVPAGMKAEVTGSKGAVKTVVLKTESSMPDFNL